MTTIATSLRYGENSLIIGAPGVGKTRALREIKRRAGAREIEHEVALIDVSSTVGGSLREVYRLLGEALDVEHMDDIAGMRRRLVKKASRFPVNFGADAKAPRCEFRIEKPQFVSVLTSALGTLVPLGLKVSQEDVRARLGMPSPAPGTELLVPPAGEAAPPDLASPAEDGGEPAPLPRYAVGAAWRGATAHGRSLRQLGEAHRGGPLCSCGCGQPVAALNRAAEVVTPAERDELDLVDRIGLDESRDWQDQTGPMLDAIMQAAGRSSTYAEFGAELTKLYGSIPTGGLAKRLAIATTEARGLGETFDDV